MISYIFIFWSQGRASLVAQSVKNLPAMQETWVRFLGQENPLEKEMATHSTVIAWRIPWTEEPGGFPVHGVARIRHDLATKPLLTILWLHWVSTAACGLSLVAASGRPLSSCGVQASHRGGSSRCGARAPGTRASVAAAHGLSGCGLCT